MVDEEKKAKKEVKHILVVAQLPTQAVNTAKIEGVDYELIGLEDAITEILVTVRELKKQVG